MTEHRVQTTPGYPRKDSRIQDRAAETRPRQRRDVLSPDRQVPTRQFLAWVVEVNVSAITGFLFGMLTIGPVLGVLCACVVLFGPWPEVDPLNAFSIGMFAGWMGTGLAFALLTCFDWP
jgi:hypothetical protein